MLRLFAAALALGSAMIAAQDSQSAYARAAALFAAGKTAEAEAVLKPLATTDPNDPRVWNLLGVVLDSSRQYEPAEQCFHKALQLAPRSAAILNNLGNHYIAAGKADQALATFRKVVTLEPQHPNANAQLAALLIQRNDAKGALEHLGRLNGPDAETPGIQLLRARALHATGRKTEAMSIFAAVEQHAAGASDWYSIGMAKAAVEEFEGAEASFSRALEADPGNLDILHDLGVAALRAGHSARAQQVFETMLRAKPDDAEALFQLGRATADQGRFDDAVLVLAQARRIAPARPEIIFALAVTSAKAGFFGDAALAFDDYLKLRPDDEIARRERGFAYSCAGKKVEALRDLEWYAGRHPKDAQGRFELGMALSVSDIGKAIANLTEAIRLKPDFPEAHFARGEIYARDGRPAEGVGDLEYAVSHRPDHIRAVAALGRVYLQLDRPRDAVRVLRPGYEKAPRDPQILMLLGRALTANGQREEGARILEEFARVGPDRSLARVEPGVLELLNLPAGEFDKRYEANLRSTLMSSRGDPQVRAQLAKFLLSRNRKDEGLTEYRQVLASSPSPAISLECGRNLIEAEEFAMAKQFLEITAADPVLQNGARLDLAIALVGTGEAQAAIQKLEEVPDKARLGDYYLVRAQVLDALGQVKQAAESLNAALDKAPTRADLYIQATYFLLRHEEDAQALKLLEMASSRIPGDGALLLLKATLLGALNRTDEALALLQKITARWPEWARPYLVRGIIEENHSDSENALKSIDAAIAMGEHSAEAYYYLAQATYHATPDATGRAMEAIRRSLDLDPSDPWAQALAGRLAWELQDFESSVRYLQAAIRLKKDFVKAHFWLGATYRSMGQIALADSELAEVTRIHQQNPHAESEGLEGSRDGLFGIRR